MNYMDAQQQYIMQQGQRMQSSRMISMPPGMPQQHMQRPQRYGMAMMQPNQQYVQNNQMQSRTINDALSRLPHDVHQMAQQQISAETNIERKKQIALSFIQNHRMRSSQSYQPQNSMNARGMVVNMVANQQIPVNPNTLGNTGAVRMGSPNMSQGPVYAGQVQQMQNNQMQMQRVVNHGYLSNNAGSGQIIQNFNLQEQMSAPNMLPNYSSSHPSNISQQNSVVQSQNQVALMAQKDEANQEASEKAAAEEPLFRQKFDILKSYYEHIKRLIDRLRIEGQPPKASYERLIEIMENRRKVDLKFVEKLIVSVRAMIQKSAVCYPMLEVIRNIDVIRPVFPDPWCDIGHCPIRLPDEVLALKRNNKRKASPLSEATSSKRFHRDHEEANIAVKCVDGSVIHLPHEASEELRLCRYRLNPSHQPMCKKSAEVLFEIENDSVLPLTLQLVVPVTYPEDRAFATVCEDHWSSMKFSKKDIHAQFENRLFMSDKWWSITEIVNAWNEAVQHIISTSGPQK